MSRLVSGLLTIAALFAVASLATADGYTYSNGHYYKGGQSYYRSQSYSPGYYSSGYYYPGSYSYQYYPSYSYTPSYTYPTYSYPSYSYSSSTYVTPTYTPPPAPKEAVKDPGWRARLIELAKDRDKQELAIRAGQFDQQWFMEAVKALGLEGNFNIKGYGPPAPYAVYSSYQYAPAALGTQGTTLYGYTAQSVLSAYGDANIAQLYAQAFRLADGSQKLSAQASTDFGALVDKQGSNHAKVAEILARGEAAERVLRSLEMPSAKLESSGTVFKTPGVDPAPMNPAIVPPAATPAVSRQAFLQNRTMRCGTCHSGGKSEGGFTLDLYDGMNRDQKARVWGRLFTSDPGKRMPRNPDGSAAPVLPQAELKEWLDN